MNFFFGINKGFYYFYIDLIKDEFWFEYRGMYVDVLRNFRIKEDLLRLMEVMLMYKMNKFYLYFIDDEGW